MAIISGDYTLIYYKYRNEIKISLPQTAKTMENTVAPISNRRTDIMVYEEAAILELVKRIFEMTEEDREALREAELRRMEGEEDE